MSEYKPYLERIGSGLGTGRILVHSDMFRVRSAVRTSSSVEQMLSKHVELLGSIVSVDRLLFPTFNYDFLRTGVYNVRTDISQVGPLSEYARTCWSQWRSSMPVFNVCGIGSFNNKSVDNRLIDPFGSESIFADLYDEAGSLLFYGSEIASATAIHYIERKSGGPVYRYDKLFSGLVLNNNASQKVTISYHCRPHGCSLDYNFDKIESQLMLEGLIKAIDLPGFTVKLVNYRAMVDFLVNKIEEDPLFLLDDNSYKWVSAKLDLLGRRFEISDFEAR